MLFALHRPVPATITRSGKPTKSRGNGRVHVTSQSCTSLRSDMRRGKSRFRRRFEWVARRCSIRGLAPRPAAHLPPVEEPPPDHGPTPDPPPVEQPPPIEDQLERFLVLPFLRRYVTWCARVWG